MKITLYLLITVASLSSPVWAHFFEQPLTALPRIVVCNEDGVAVLRDSSSNEIFRPIGSNYVPGLVHRTFSPGFYDQAAAEVALAKMAKGGFTTVRTWAYHGHWQNRADGFYAMEGPQSFRLQDSPELWQPYVDNLVDFIARANNHGIYVHLVIDREPDKPFYRDRVNGGYPDIEGFVHREYLTSGSIEAKEIYIAELIDNIRSRNPDLLSTILVYEIRNEIHANTNVAPFNRTEGDVTTAAGIYDTGNPESRLACFEDNVTLFLNRATAAIKEADPEALTTASIFAYLPVGKDGLYDEGLLPIEMSDTRWPVLPRVLVRSDIDVVSFHSYIPDNWGQALSSSGFRNEFLSEKPFVAGEFGALRRAFDTVDLAAQALLNYRNTILGCGFLGAYLFTWNTYEHTRWTMTEEGAVIFESMRPINARWTGENNGDWGNPSNWDNTPNFAAGSVFDFHLPNAQSTSNTFLGDADRTVSGLIFNENLSGNMTIRMAENVDGSGARRFLLINNNSFDARISVRSGATGDITIVNGHRLDFVSDTTLTHNGSGIFRVISPIGNNGRLTINGSGVVVLANGSTWNRRSSGVVLRSGTLRIASGDSLGVSQSGDDFTAQTNPFVMSGGTLTANSTDTITFGRNRLIELSGILTFGCVGDYSGALTFDARNPTTLTGDVTINTISRTDLRGVIGESGGSRSLTKDGPELLILTANNSFSGGLTVMEGTVGTWSASATVFGTGNITMHSGTTLLTTSGTGTHDNPIHLDSGNVTMRLGGGSTGTDTRTFTGVISGEGGITKTDIGTQILTGTNTYTGATNVNAGGLIVDGSIGNGLVIVAKGARIGGVGSLAGGLTLTEGARFVFNPNATLTVFGTATLPNGFSINDLVTIEGSVIDWNAIESGTYTLIEGAVVGIDDRTVALPDGRTAFFKEGSLQLVIEDEPSDPYFAWIDELGLADGDAAVDADPDDDGVANLLEFVFDGNPTVPNTANLPVAEVNANGDMLFVFTRRMDSVELVDLTFEYSPDLSNWSSQSVPESSSGNISIAVDTPAAGLETVTITVPASAAPDGRLFGRLRAQLHLSLK